MCARREHFRTINDAEDIEGNSYTLDVEKVLAVTTRQFPLELPVADYNNTLDDEFARRFGGATLNLLALSNPELRPFIKITSAND
ncbi:MULTISPECIES: hypothetical protein [unclassified Paraburkholderia]